MSGPHPVLISFIRDKVAYAGKDFISVVFEDYHFRIDGSEIQTSLRTRNFSLTDGFAYEIDDVV